MLFSEERLIWPCCGLTTCPGEAEKLWISLMYPRPDLENQRFRKSICPLTPKDQHVISKCYSERFHDARLQRHLTLVFTSVCEAAEVHSAPSCAGVQDSALSLLTPTGLESGTATTTRNNILKG